ncbi:MAG: serine/threonine protein kinase [Deltaproteobacteria bacterium]|nr:serine/threonine protein kinase [Deltaproteobacteria bacterium]
MQLEVGALVADRYRLDAKLGAGGMAVVWAATHIVTGKAVALKFLAREYTAHEEARARFVREARAASMVDHPHVVAIHDVVELRGGRLVMVMDLLVGESLRERLDRVRALSLTDTTRILLPVISAVGTAHNVGVVHRDLKPDNIFLTARPESVRVLDFGIAKLTKKAANPSDLTVTGSVLGTPHYMAPEQIFGERDVDARADVWGTALRRGEPRTDPQGHPPLQGSTAGRAHARGASGAQRRGGSHAESRARRPPGRPLRDLRTAAEARPGRGQGFWPSPGAGHHLSIRRRRDTEPLHRHGHQQSGVGRPAHGQRALRRGVGR